MRTNDEMGARIRNRRKELLLSQEELALRLDVSRQQVQRYEKGTDTLNVERLQALSRELEVPCCYFFGQLNGLEGEERRLEEELLFYFHAINVEESKRLLVDFARGLSSAGNIQNITRNQIMLTSLLRLPSSLRRKERKG